MFLEFNDIFKGTLGKQTNKQTNPSVSIPYVSRETVSLDRHVGFVQSPEYLTGKQKNFTMYR